MQTTSIEAAPAAVSELLQQALRHHEAKEFSAAHALYTRILEQDPANVDAWNLIGLVCLELRRPDMAIAMISRALTIRPDYAEAHNNLGSAQASLFLHNDAMASYRRAVALKPGFAEAWLNLADVLRATGRFEEAIEPYQRFEALRPDCGVGAFHLSNLLQAMRRNEEAEAAARRALAVEPESHLAWISLGRALIGQDRQLEAAECLEKALALQPDSIEALLETAGTFERWRMPDRAASFYRLVLDRDPDHALALSRLIDMQLSLCDWREYRRFCNVLVERIEGEMAQDKPISTDVFNLHALPVDQAFSYRVARHKAAIISREAAPAKARCAFSFQQRNGGRIRIGYLLPYTTKQSMPIVLEPVVAAHDRTRFEVFGYSLMACDGVPFSVAFRKHFDSFADMVKISPEAAAQRIYADGIDVLIDTTGHTSVNWLEVLALQPAPVQVHYLGYSLTSGSDFIQYLITDRRFIPPEWEGFCSERLVYLPDSFMATVRAPVAPLAAGREAHGLPPQGFVFANFNHPCKFEPDMFGIWMKILAQVPGSVLWLGHWMHATRENLRREAEARGIEGERLVFARIVEHAEHLARLSLADLALDNRYHGGGVTTVDALWAGLPVLTVAGGGPAARLGATLATAAGVPELIVESLAGYEARAVALAGDPAGLAAVRARLQAGRISCPLFDGERYRRHLERAYEMMWQRHLQGLPPGRIDVPTLD